MTATSIQGRGSIAASILLASALLLALLVALSAATTPGEAQSTILYVDIAATGANDGSSWTDAFTSLQDTLAVAQDGDEIWVAAGVYYPDEGSGQTNNARQSAFNIPPGVSLYGGFAGDETARNQRDWEANPTVLSGDIDGNDVTDARGVVTDTAKIAGNNALHVVWLDGTTTPITASTRLDGVIITAGEAEEPDGNGGGLVILEGSPALTNVTFSGNFAGTCGGAIYSDSSRPTLIDVAFSANEAKCGGAIYNNESDATLTNATFNANSANTGGAVHNENGDARLLNVTFNDNSAQAGGAIYNGGSNLTLTNATFSANDASVYGGAMYSGGGTLTLANATLSGNSAYDGGALYNIGNEPALTNVTFSGNSAGGEGGAIYNQNSAPTIQNSILWNNQDNSGTATAGASIVDGSNSATSIHHSLVQGWNPAGDGNLDGTNPDNDPLFLSPIDPGDGPVTGGDLRLQPGSPAIDAGDNSALPAGVTTDLDGNPRLRDGDNDGAPAVDMGAYEFISPVINVGLAPTSVTEDNGAAMTVTFTRTVNTSGVLTATFAVGGSATFSADYAQSGTSRFDGSSGSVTFIDGAISRTLLITPTADLIDEPDESITITLSASTTYSVGVPAAVTAVIRDDDSAGVAVDPTDGLVTTEAGGADTFTVSLQSQPAGVVTVTLTSSDPGEGTVSPALLIFDAGNWQTPQTVTVTGVDDDEDDGDVAYTIQTTVSSDDPAYDGIGADDIGVTNLDDDDSDSRIYLPLLSGPATGMQ